MSGCNPQHTDIEVCHSIKIKGSCLVIYLCNYKPLPLIHTFQNNVMVATV